MSGRPAPKTPLQRCSAGGTVPPIRRRRRIATKARTLGAMGLGLALFVAFASPAHAAIRTVTTATDDNTGDPSPGQLRYEIREAAPGDTIRIAPGINPQLQPPGAAVPDVTGQILIDKNLIIEGQGANQTAITVPGHSSRIFVIASMFPAPVVTIRDLRLTRWHRSGRGDRDEPGSQRGRRRERWGDPQQRPADAEPSAVRREPRRRRRLGRRRGVDHQSGWDRGERRGRRVRRSDPQHGGGQRHDHELDLRGEPRGQRWPWRQGREQRRQRHARRRG